MDPKLVVKGLKLLFTQPLILLQKLSHTKISYSQGWEDILLDYLFWFQKKWFYIDIWANHPKRLSNTLLFYKKNWSGINIEPNITLYKEFLKCRKRDINLNVGIGTGEGEYLNFYCIDSDTLSTFDKASAELYEKEGHKIVEVQKVSIISLNKVFADYVKGEQVDFISVDTEWYDMEVLKSNDWEKNRPGFVILETIEYKKNGFGKKLNGTYDEYFQKIRYHKYADTYINTIYISEEYAQKFKLAF